MPKQDKPAFQMYIEQGFCQTPREFARAIREIAKAVETGLGVKARGTVYNKYGDGCGAWEFAPYRLEKV